MALYIEYIVATVSTIGRNALTRIDRVHCLLIFYNGCWYKNWYQIAINPGVKFKVARFHRKSNFGLWKMRVKD